VPTTRPRYTLTDTGRVARALDVATGRWPGRPRRELLELLLDAGAQRVSEEEAERERQLARQHEALRRIPELLDAAVLLSDEAWR
jgi:hypothetical protein